MTTAATVVGYTQLVFASGPGVGARNSIGAVGVITEASYANEIITGGDADLVLLGRELLREPTGRSRRNTR